jgi:cation diffusion facilitator family transporter
MPDLNPTPHCSQPELYRGPETREYERRTRAVVILTFFMMAVEVIGGTWFHSMALLADGFHMATHVGALGISAFAYAYARNHHTDPRYSFGTGKVSDLAGFSSAIILAIIALYVIFESASRLIAPVNILYGEAIPIACVGLAVNIASAIILHGAHSHHHDHEGHDHSHEHNHQDNNFRSAYIHIIADGVTSVMAIIALGCGYAFGWRWMDPVMGGIGAFVILSWARGLMRDTGAVLLDRVPETDAGAKIRAIVEGQGARITDLHIWRVGPGCHAAILAVTSTQVNADQVREWLKPLGLAHVTIEISSGF